MDRRVNLTIGQLLSSAVTILIAILSAWVSLTGRVKTLEVSTEIRLQQIEKQQNSTAKQYERILNELNCIKISLENKQDRK